MRHLLAASIMLSSMLIPAVANASPSTDDVTAPTANLRVSTGVVAPTLTQSLNIPVPDGIAQTFIPANAEVGLSFTVDSAGKASDVKITKPTNSYWDARVVEAIQNSHFRPGTIDNEPIPMDVNLTVLVTR